MLYRLPEGMVKNVSWLNLRMVHTEWPRRKKCAVPLKWPPEPTAKISTSPYLSFRGLHQSTYPRQGAVQSWSTPVTFFRKPAAFQDDATFFLFPFG